MKQFLRTMKRMKRRKLNPRRVKATHKKIVQRTRRSMRRRRRRRTRKRKAIASTHLICRHLMTVSTKLQRTPSILTALAALAALAMTMLCMTLE